MGVTGLIPLLKPIQRPVHLDDLRGQTLGIDGYVWLHRGAYACAIELALDQPTTRYIDFFMKRIQQLLDHQITPYVVFDGGRLPMKAATDHQRSARRREMRARGQQFYAQGRRKEAFECFSSAVSVTPRMASRVIVELERRGIRFLVAPYEADAQLAYLDQIGAVDAVLTEDSDLVVFGARHVILKLGAQGDAVGIMGHRIREMDALKSMSHEQFRHMCILSGCDYLASLPGIGLKRAMLAIQRYGTGDRVLEAWQQYGKAAAGGPAKPVPDDYAALFRYADRMFLHQQVYCPLDRTMRPRVPLPADYAEDPRFMALLGPVSHGEELQRIVTGRQDPETGEPFADLFDPAAPTAGAALTARRPHAARLQRHDTMPTVLSPSAITAFGAPLSQAAVAAAAGGGRLLRDDRSSSIETASQPPPGTGALPPAAATALATRSATDPWPPRLPRSGTFGASQPDPFIPPSPPSDGPRHAVTATREAAAVAIKTESGPASSSAWAAFAFDASSTSVSTSTSTSGSTSTSISASASQSQAGSFLRRASFRQAIMGDAVLSRPRAPVVPLHRSVTTLPPAGNFGPSPTAGAAALHRSPSTGYCSASHSHSHSHSYTRSHSPADADADAANANATGSGPSHPEAGVALYKHDSSASISSTSTLLLDTEFVSARGSIDDPASFHTPSTDGDGEADAHTDDATTSRSATSTSSSETPRLLPPRATRRTTSASATASAVPRKATGDRRISHFFSVTASTRSSAASTPTASPPSASTATAATADENAPDSLRPGPARRSAAAMLAAAPSPAPASKSARSSPTTRTARVRRVLVEPDGADGAAAQNGATCTTRVVRPAHAAAWCAAPRSPTSPPPPAGSRPVPRTPVLKARPPAVAAAAATPLASSTSAAAAATDPLARKRMWTTLFVRQAAMADRRAS